MALLLEGLQNINEFSKLTLREVKSGLKMPLQEVLAVLAKIESVYWVPRPLDRESTATPLMGETHLVDDAIIQSINDCIAAGWVQQLNPNDLRFPLIAGSKVSDWLESQARKTSLSNIEFNLCMRLCEANKATWAQELRSLASIACTHSSPKPGSDGGRQRWVDIFTARYGRIRGNELQGVGDEFSLTRERVRQICEAILDVLRTHPIKMPALDRLMRMCERITPCPIDVANEQLAPFLGDGFGIAAALRFAQAIGLTIAIKESDNAARTSDGYKPISLLVSTEDQVSWVSAAYTHARRDCMFIGCTNFIRVAGLLALEESVAQDLETLRSVFEEAPGFRMLDERSGWFTLSDSEASAVGTRFRKLMSVADDGVVGIDDIASALSTDDRWLSREAHETGRALAVPPVHVLVELFSGWEWLRGDGHNKFTSTEAIEREEVLSKTEQAAISVIERHNGAATRAEISDFVVDHCGTSSVAASQVMSSSPALIKLDHSIYGLRSHPIPAEALIECRNRRTAEQLARHPYANIAIDMSKPIRTVVTQSGSVVAASRRVVYLPSYLAGKVTCDFTDKHGTLPSISVRSNNQIRALSQAAETFGVGRSEKFEIEFDLQARTYELFKIAQ